MSPIIYFSQWAWHCNKKHDLNVCEKTQDTRIRLQALERMLLLSRWIENNLLHFSVCYG